MNTSISKNNNYETYACYLLFIIALISFFIGFDLRENSAGGGLIDLKHEWHNYNLLKSDNFGFLFGNYEASRFPLFHILNLKLNPFINSQSDFILSFFIYSFILILTYYYCLVFAFKNQQKHIIFLLLSILLLSPYFRTSSFWGLQENLAYIFFLTSFALYEKNKKIKLLIIFVSFLSFYSDQKYIFVPAIFFFKYLNKDQIFNKENFKLIAYCIILFLPAMLIFYIWGGLTKDETTSGINEFSFRPQNILFSLNIIFLYLIPFIFLKYNKFNLNELFNRKNIIFYFLFGVLYFFIRAFYIDVSLPISGGWAFKIFINLFNLNTPIAEIIYFFISFLSFLVIFSYFKILKISLLNKMILLFLISYVLFMEIVFQEYFDPLMLFIAIFFLHREDIATINFKKSFLLYLYFLAFWVGSISYYYLYI